MVKLNILGPPELRDEDGNLDESFLSGPKRLALLSYLALARPRGFKRRDSLLPLFWPNRDQKSARNALSNLIYHIRQSLGSDMIVNRGNEEIKLGDLSCDVDRFQEAITNNHYEKAAQFYRGNLLEGLHLADASQQFEEWLDLKRGQFQRKYREVLKNLAKGAEERGDLQAAVNWWYKCRQESPFDADTTRRLMTILVAANKKTEAMDVGRKLAEKLEKEFGADIDKEFEKLTDGLETAAAEIKEIKAEPETVEVVDLGLAGIPNLDQQNAQSIHRALKHFQLTQDTEEKNYHYKKALDIAYKARKNQPGMAVNHVVEGLALYHLERYSEAMFAFEEAVSLTGDNHIPSQTEVKSLLAVVYSRKGNISEVKKLLGRIREKDDWFSAGLVHAALGETERALNFFERLTDWNTFSGLCYSYLFPEILKPIRKKDKTDQNF